MCLEFRQGKKIKTLKLGFSWTILFFGPLIFLFRRQFALALTWLGVDLWISYLYLFVYRQSEMKFWMLTGMDIFYSAFWIAMAVFGNRWTCYHLHRTGRLITPTLNSPQVDGLIQPE